LWRLCDGYCRCSSIGCWGIGKEVFRHKRFVFLG
jgi:hypothetical protein